MSKPEWTFAELSRAMTEMVGCGDPNAGPPADAPPRGVKRLVADMAAGATRADGALADVRLFVLRASDLPAIAGLVKIVEWAERSTGKKVDRTQ